ncbi:MAG: putative hydro-lyase [Planctomycetaceae bacterium]
MSRSALRTGADVRAACRRGLLTGQTSGLADGYAQANLVILPREFADDFLLFCRRNPRPCPLLDVTEPGSTVPTAVAPDADLRTDLPKYRVWEDGELVAEPTDIRASWRDDFVSFVIGCSFTFESALVRAGIPVRHLELGCNVSMYRTNIACEPAGRFHGPLVVSMRPLKPADAIRAVQITSRYPDVHGAPVHLGLPEQIGIADLSQPDFGDAVPIEHDELPVFWACGVTPQAVMMAAKPPLAITHSPGCMLVTDVRDEMLEKTEKN